MQHLKQPTLQASARFVKLNITYKSVFAFTVGTVLDIAF